MELRKRLLRFMGLIGLLFIITSGILLIAPKIEKRSINERGFTPVILYREEEYVSGETHVLILRKVGNQESEVLLDRIEPPGIRDYLLQRDRSHLFITLGDKVEALNLATKRLEKLFVSQSGEISGIVESPDGKSLFLSTSKPSKDSEGENFTFYIINRLTGSSTVVKSGEQYRLRSFSPLVWRKDNKIVMRVSYPADFSPDPFIWYFDVNTNQLQKTSTKASHYISGDGIFIASEKTFIESDPCDAIGLGTPEIYAVVDVISGEKITDIGDLGKITTEIVFSPDSKEALYGIHSPLSPPKEFSGGFFSSCREIVDDYYKKNLRSGEITRIDIDTYNSLKSIWYNKPNISIYYNDMQKLRVISIDNKPWFTAKGLDYLIIGSYFQ